MQGFRVSVLQALNIQIIGWVLVILRGDAEIGCVQVGDAIRRDFWTFNGLKYLEKDNSRHGGIR